MIKYVGDLIQEVRRDSRNEDAPSSTEEVGISNEDFLRYLNFAQEKCQSVAISAKSTKFQATKEIFLTSGVEQYSINDNVYLDEHILKVEYSHTGLARDYYELRERSLGHRNGYPGIPSFYIRRGSSILLCPIYNSNGAKVRITYDRAVDSLDLRRGVVQSRLIGAGSVAALTIDPSTADNTALLRAQYLCINDRFGNVTMYNIPVISYNTLSGVTLIANSSFRYQEGETIEIGDYVTVGRYTTTHSKLNSLCERYLAQYAEYKIFRRDSSSDANGAREDMRETLTEIATNYREAPRDEADIQIDNKSLVIGLW